MTKKAFIVVGIHYGDEGKGLCTDFLCSRSIAPLVIRFNGGHQAGHTVVTNSGMRHMFSNFGSGTLRNIPTYWSRFCTFSPAYLLYELEGLPVQPRLLLDLQCPVSTHYDVLFNRALEATRGKQRLGSCGVGFGATTERHNNAGVEFRVSDLFSLKGTREKLGLVRRYYKIKMEEETRFSFEQFDHDSEDKVFEENIDKIHQLASKSHIEFTREETVFASSEWQTYIFEGAQGILLDQNFGAKPFITKSNTTSQNAISLLRSNTENVDLEVFYVTRCYLTRHGSGPFRVMDHDYNLKNTENETNVYNEHQGEFKVGFLDLNLSQYAINCDEIYSKGSNKNLLITCLDQIQGDKITYIKNERRCNCSIETFGDLLSSDINKMYFSFSPCSDSIRIDEK